MSKPPSLEFINVSHPGDIKNRHTRRKIHQHVMKDIGQSRRRNASSKTVELHVPSPSSNAGNGPSATRALNGRQPSPQTPPPLADLTLYADTTGRVRRLESFIMQEDGPMCQRLRELCFTLAMFDDSAMHLALAHDSLATKEVAATAIMSENDMALRHYTCSLRLVYTQIKQATTKKVGDAIIGTIIGLSSYDLATGNFERFLTHIDGLEVIIKSRGGIKTVHSEYIKRALLWSDLVGALSLDKEPRFADSTDTRYLHGCPIHSPVPSGISEVFRARYPTLNGVGAALEAVSDLAAFASRPIPTPDGSFEIAFSLTVGLVVSLPRYKPDAVWVPDDVVVHEVVRLAAIIFLMGPVGALTRNQGAALNHRGRIPRLMRSYQVDWSELHELELWVLVVGSMVDSGDDRAYLASRISDCIHAHGLEWDNVPLALEKVAWPRDYCIDEMAKLGAEVSSLSRDYLHRSLDAGSVTECRKATHPTQWHSCTRLEEET